MDIRCLTAFTEQSLALASFIGNCDIPALINSHRALATVFQRHYNRFEVILSNHSLHIANFLDTLTRASIVQTSRLLLSTFPVLSFLQRDSDDSSSQSSDYRTGTVYDIFHQRGITFIVTPR